MSTVSATSSALCPVTTCLTPSCAAPLSSACLRKTPQYRQLEKICISPDSIQTVVAVSLDSFVHRQQDQIQTPVASLVQRLEHGSQHTRIFASTGTDGHALSRVAQRRWWFLGRRICARFSLHAEHNREAMVVCGMWSCQATVPCIVLLPDFCNILWNVFLCRTFRSRSCSALLPIYLIVLRRARDFVGEGILQLLRVSVCTSPLDQLNKRSTGTICSKYRTCRSCSRGYLQCQPCLVNRSIKPFALFPWRDPASHPSKLSTNQPPASAPDDHLEKKMSDGQYCCSVECELYCEDAFAMRC
ncbi:hypothetical protein KCV06_g151, partial [Aureobasidium melanogenum]